MDAAEEGLRAGDEAGGEGRASPPSALERRSEQTQKRFAQAVGQEVAQLRNRVYPPAAAPPPRTLPPTNPLEVVPSCWVAAAAQKGAGAMWCAAGRVCVGTLDTASLRLLESSELGDSEGVLRAIGEGGKLDAGHPGWLDYTPLHMASLHGHLEVARLLITAGATVASLACDGATPLHLAGSGAVAVSQPTCPHAHA
eukprot:COSAG01_NODE_4750_length_4766_cov_16.850043_4_plen_197_part_00